MSAAFCNSLGNVHSRLVVADWEAPVFLERRPAARV